MLRGLTGDVFRVRQSSLEANLPRLDAEWTAGCRKAGEPVVKACSHIVRGKRPFLRRRTTEAEQERDRPSGCLKKSLETSVSLYHDPDEK